MMTMMMKDGVLLPFNMNHVHLHLALFALLISGGRVTSSASSNHFAQQSPHSIPSSSSYDYDPSSPHSSNFNYDVGQMMSSPFLRPLRRLGSEFLGKRSSLEDEMGVTEEDDSSPFNAGGGRDEQFSPSSGFGGGGSGLEKRARIRMGSEFLGKRRLGSEFLGKKKRGALGSEFLGKRGMSYYPFGAGAYPSPFYGGGDWASSWKRARLGSEFLGKRAKGIIGSEFLGKRDIPLL